MLSGIKSVERAVGLTYLYFFHRWLYGRRMLISCRLLGGTPRPLHEKRSHQNNLSRFWDQVLEWENIRWKIKNLWNLSITTTWASGDKSESSLACEGRLGLYSRETVLFSQSGSLEQALSVVNSTNFPWLVWNLTVETNFLLIVLAVPLARAK